MTIASTQQISAVVDADRDKTIALDVVTIPSVRPMKLGSHQYLHDVWFRRGARS
jgi:hypothetical protein